MAVISTDLPTCDKKGWVANIHVFLLHKRRKEKGLGEEVGWGVGGGEEKGVEGGSRGSPMRRVSRREV
jgi:hypothetical protein